MDSQEGGGHGQLERVSSYRRSVLNWLPVELTVKFLQTLLQRCDLATLQNIVIEYPELKRIILVVRDHSPKFTDDTPMIELLVKTVDVSAYLSMSSEQRRLTPLIILELQYFVENGWSDLNYSESCTYARLLSKETCVVLANFKDCPVQMEIMTKHCNDSRVPVLIQKSKLVHRPKAVVIRLPSHGIFKYVSESIPADCRSVTFRGYSWIDRPDYLSRYIIGWNVMDAIIEIPITCRTYSRCTAPLVRLVAPRLHTVSIIFKSAKVPEINLKIPRDVKGLTTAERTAFKGSRFVLKNDNWSYSNPYGAGCFHNDTDPHRDQASWSVMDEDRIKALPSSPAFRTVHLEGLSDAALRMLAPTKKILNHLYWKRLCPSPLYRTRRIERVEPEILELPDLKTLRIYSVIRKDLDHTNPLPVFKKMHWTLEELFLVALTGSDMFWKLNTLLDVEYHERLKTVCLANIIDPKDEPPVIEHVNDLMAICMTSDDLWIWGYAAKFILKSTYVRKDKWDYDCYFMNLKSLHIDLSCMPIESNESPEEGSALYRFLKKFKGKNGKQKKGRMVLVYYKIHMRKCLFPNLLEFRLMSPLNRHIIFGDYVALNLRLPPVNTLLCNETIPVCQLRINGNDTECDPLQKRRVDFCSVWEWMGPFTGFQQSESRRKHVEFTDWIDQPIGKMS